MNRTAFVRKLECICHATEGSMDEGTLLKKLPGWDSMATVEFISAIDEEYGVTVDYEKIVDCQTVGNLVDAVDECVKRA